MAISREPVRAMDVYHKLPSRNSALFSQNVIAACPPFESARF